MILFPTAIHGADTFAVTGSLGSARYDHTATLLSNGKVLVAGGYGPGGILANVELYDPAAGTWAAAGSLATARSSHTASLLPNGKVLFAGGEGASNILTSAELYDPTTGTWAIINSLGGARRSHSATLLPNGKVLVAGGDNGSGSLASAELYDPATGTWSTTSSLAIARSSHSATLLPNGKVFVVGGKIGFSSLASAELYNPGDGYWSAAGTLSIPRSSHTSALLPNGKLLIAGGYFDNNALALANADLYDPVADIWTYATLATARYGHTSTLLPNGKLLIAGGNTTASAELYDATTGAFISTGPLATERQGHTATLLWNGEVLVTGGYGPSGILASTELYNSATGAWTGAGSLATARYDYTATLLPNGKVLAAGGGDNSSGPLASVELYNPATETWTATGSLATARRGFTATLLPNGKVLAAGGYGPSGMLASAELYDPETGVWSDTGPLATARYDHTATLLPNGKVLVAGGRGSGTLASAELYDPATGAWIATGPLAAARYDYSATLLPNGKVLVAGGGDNLGYIGTAELYDPASGIWTATGSLATARFDHTATLLPSGKVLAAAGQGDGVLLANAELYDPSTGTWAATGSLVSTRRGFTAILLPHGQVLVAGGYGPRMASTVELYNPATGTWTGSNTIVGALSDHTATLLPNGKVLVAGGYTYTGVSSTYLYEAGLGFTAGWQPQISSASFNATGRLVLVGTGLRGISSASGGNGSQDSPSNHPVVQLRSLNNGQGDFLLSDPATSVSDTTFTSMPVTPLPFGHTWVTVFSNGIPSVSVVVSPPLVPLVSLVASPGSTVEGGTCVFFVQLSMVSGFPVTVNYATADATAVAPGDYTAASGQLTIPAGQTSGQIVIQTASDTDYEASETFTVTISNPVNSTLDVAGTTGLIIDNDPPPLVSLVASPGSTIEGGTCVFSVQLSTVFGLPVTVNYATADGTALALGDYTAASGQLTIPAGQTSGQIVIQTASDTQYEANETFTVTISNPVNSTLDAAASATGLINNNDPPPLITLSTGSTLEGGTCYFSVQLSTVSGLPVTVNYATANGTAVAPGDYTAASGQVTIPAGQTSGQIVIQTATDTHYEAEYERFTVTISDLVNCTLDGSASANGLIWEVDPLLLSYVPSGSSWEGSTCYFSFQLSTVSTLPVTVDYATVNGTAVAPGDYTAASGKLTIPAGQTSGQIVIQTADDTQYEANETFRVTISNPVNCLLDGTAASAPYGLIFNNDPPPLVSLVASPGSTVEGGTCVFSVQLSIVSGLAVTVNFATADGTAVAPGDYTAVSSQLTIPAGQTSGQIVIQSASDTHYEVNETFRVTISNPVNCLLDVTAASVTGLINNNDPPPLGLTNMVAEAGDGTTPPSVSGTVTGAPPFGLVVAEVSSDLGANDPWESFAVLGTDGEGSATFVGLLAPAERLGARRLFFRFRSP